jgi:NAD(P)-dependent dehydrogenase (short-subunit alcohol dehydrogenase family)
MHMDNKNGLHLDGKSAVITGGASGIGRAIAHRFAIPFVDGYLKKNYPGREAEMFDRLSRAQPIGRMANPEEVAALALFLCSEEAALITA